MSSERYPLADGSEAYRCSSSMRKELSKTWRLLPALVSLFLSKFDEFGDLSVMREQPVVIPNDLRILALVQLQQCFDNVGHDGLHIIL